MKQTKDIKLVPTQERLPYATPEITLELELETRAGTPLGIGGDDPLDLTGLGTNDYVP